MQLICVNPVKVYASFFMTFTMQESRESQETAVARPLHVPHASDINNLHSVPSCKIKNKYLLV